MTTIRTPYRIGDGDLQDLVAAKAVLERLPARIRGNGFGLAGCSDGQGEHLNIELVRAPVGDKYVMEEMLNRGLSLGAKPGSL